MAVVSKDLFSYNNLVHAIAGATGSMIGMTVFYPLETVRSRLQLEEKRKAKNTIEVLRELIQEEGFGTLYRGIVPVLQSICASNFVYFYIYHGLKAYVASNKKGNWDLLLATIAGSVNVLVTTPLWLVNTRLKMSGVSNEVVYKNLLEGLVSIAKKDGVTALWNGTLPSLLLVSNPALHMAVYETLKRRFRSNSALAYFFLSAIAKISATVSTYPIQIVQAKQRHGNSNSSNSRSNAGMIQILLAIMMRDGVEGLFKGLESKLLQTVLTTALMFMCYEKIVAFVFRIMKK